MTQGTAHRLLEALDEPAFLLALSGTIRHANAAALWLLGHGGDKLVGCPLSELTVDAPEAVARLLRRYAGSGQSMVGALRVRAKDGSVRKCRCHGCRVGGPPDSAEPLLLLRLEGTSHERFAVLTEKIVAINAEIRHGRLAEH